MALYDRRFILLVREGVRLPSNLQGLYVVTYAGDSMDAGDSMTVISSSLPTGRSTGPVGTSTFPSNLALSVTVMSTL